MLLASRVIPVLRLASREQAATAIDCLIEAGFNTVEVTLTTPARSKWSGSCDAAAMQSSWLGLGPSSTCAVLQACLDAGADYLVSPCLVPGMAALAKTAGASP
jgi:2-dehydro-3-deoxyphosphogluconate aldolase/(4S)-4-hydroxy-2-oxoglutarate aldolase